MTPRLVGSGWRRLWQEGRTPWDLKGPTPILQWFLQHHSSTIASTTDILVPGCGSGWDLSVLKQHFPHSDVIGIDISEAAVSEASKNNPKCTVQVANFFEYRQCTSLIYDHTFFCAIKPAVRPQWGRQMSQLVRNGGYLVAVVYPQKDADLVNGPPFLVKLEDYQAVLPDFQLKFHATMPSGVENHPRRSVDKESIALFQKNA